MKKNIMAAILLAASVSVWGAVDSPYSHTVNADNLGRGVLAVKADTGVFISWRSMPDDDKDLSFEVYRDGVKITEEPLTKVTNFTDPEGTTSSKYSIKAILNGNEIEATNAPDVWETDYMKIHLNRPEGGTSPAGGSKEQREYTYTPDDVSVGDVDGDGEFEFIVKWFPTNQADNGDQFRYTGYTLLDCYKLDGTQLWRIDLGQNIRSGNHYTQFMVYDFDQDGKAELICKTAPGTIDGQGKSVLLGEDQVTDDYRESSGNLAGVVKSGPEYLTVFNGETGAEINTIYYNPPRDIQAHSKSGWGDANGNRCERYLAGVAYLDGVKPSAIFTRGYYTHSYVWAVDFDGEKLTERWLHSSDKAGEGIYGQGTHSLSIADLDGDGFDEIIMGAGAVDHDGTFMHSTGYGHGDALHVGDFIPENEGLEIYMPHESTTGKYSTTLRDGKTGAILYAQDNTGIDNGRGLIANVSSKYSGYEYWSSLNSNVMNHGEVVGSKRPSVNFRIYWDGDLLDELLDGTSITKPNEELTSIATLRTLNSSNAASCNSTKKTPNLQADIFGDWREEVILHDGSTESDLIIFTTTITTDYKVPCLMTDRQYREAIAWQNVGYNQPPHLSYNLEAQFDTRPTIMVTGGAINQAISLGDALVDVEFTVLRAAGAEVTGLPDGVSYTFDDSTLKGVISGTPTEKGEWTYMITTVGSEDGDDVSLQGTITVIYIDKSQISAYFSFDQIGETSVVNDCNGTEATINGSVGAAEKGVNNGAILFEGNGYLTQPIYDEIRFGNSDFSIELWMKSTDNDGYLFCIGTHNTTNIEGGTGNWVGLERLKNDNTNRLCFSIDDNVTKSDCYAENASDYFDGNWHHIVCVRNAVANSTAIYIDGSLNISNTGVGTGAINYSDTELMFIGGDDEPTVNRENRTFDGYIDEFTIYPFAMSAEDVEERFGKYEPNAVEELIAVSGNASFTVVDAFSGRIVKSAKGGNAIGITAGLEKGVYVFVIEQNGEKKTQKFIKR